MPTLRGIVGLPGSGKSHLIHNLCVQMHSAYIAFDDMGHDERWTLQRQPYFQNAWAKTMSLARIALAYDFDVLIADIAFCDANVRKQVQQHFSAYRIVWEFFANDPEQCKANVTSRNRPLDLQARELDAIQQYSPVYTPPKDARPVYRPNDARG